MTAYFGLLDIGKPKAGETVVYPAAPGPTVVVGQIAKIEGCRAVGIAGSDEKCQWMTGELGSTPHQLQEPDWRRGCATACPKGIDMNFETSAARSGDGSRDDSSARVILCGAISGYNAVDADPRPKRPDLIKRVAWKGSSSATSSADSPKR